MANRFLPAPGIPSGDPSDFSPATPVGRVLTPEEVLLAAKNFSTSLVHEIESALIGEIEKIEGKVPLPIELMEHGSCRMDGVTGDQQFFWKGRLLVTVKVGQVQDGRKGVLIEVHRQDERAGICDAEGGGEGSP